MKLKLRKLIRESVQELSLNEDYPISFDMNIFKSLTSFSARANYAQEHLRKIAAGSSRIVYQIDDEKVLKLARNAKGLAQNEVEAEHSKYEGINDILAKVISYDDNNLWIEMELAKKISKSEFKKLTGYSFEDFATALHNSEVEAKGRGGIKHALDNDIWQSMWEDEFVRDMFELVQTYAMPSGDLARISSYGLVNRNGYPTIVLVDYGASQDVLSKYY